MSSRFIPGVGDARAFFLPEMEWHSLVLWLTLIVYPPTPGLLLPSSSREKAAFTGVWVLLGLMDCMVTLCSTHCNVPVRAILSRPHFLSSAFCFVSNNHHTVKWHRWFGFPFSLWPVMLNMHLLAVCICSREKMFFAHFFSLKLKLLDFFVVFRLFAFAYPIGWK